jgi:SulP family sulfate permease
MIHSVAILFVVLVLGTAAGWIPKAALAGILFVTAVGMLDQYSLGLVRKSLVRYELAIIVLVATVTVVVDLMIAVGVGVGVAGSLFVWEQTRKPVVRRRFRGDGLLSRRTRQSDEVEVLAKHGGRTLIYELSGSLFFGTTDQLLTEVEADASTADRFLFDFSKVEDMDLSGVRVLLSVFKRLSGQGSVVAVSGLTDLERRSPRVKRLIEQLGIFEAVAEERRQTTLDLALEAFEEELLAEHLPRKSQEVPLPLAECTGFGDLTEEERARFVEALGPLLTARPGEVLAKTGAPADSLWLVRAGRVSVRSGDKGVKGVRLTSLGPGALFGVHALLDESSWPTTLRADTEVRYNRVTRASLDALRQDAPEAVRHLESAILRHAPPRSRHRGARAPRRRVRPGHTTKRCTSRRVSLR